MSHFLVKILSVGLLASWAMAQTSSAFNEYWFAGKAEISSYELSQSRYGEDREGEVVLVYVTEPFSEKKQAKLDYPSKAGGDKVSVLKLNKVKEFYTGVYPYRIMTSAFGSLKNGELIKANSTVQEWCGQQFSQLNQSGTGYDYEVRSYFEATGDQDKQLKVDFPEESIWLTVRRDPEALPQGEFKMLPSLEVLRLNHLQPVAVSARGELKKGADAWTYIYEESSSMKRKVSIEMEAKFPHRILGWTERFNSRGQQVQTTAKRKAVKMLDYWNYNSVKDADQREMLKLGE